MKTWLGFGLLLTLAVASCSSKSKAKNQAQAAFVAGQQQAAAQAQQPVVLVRGNVRNPVVPWTEELTLAQAIVAAEYASLRNPRTIMVIRQREIIPVDPKRLLRGQDMELEPGDVIEIR